MSYGIRILALGSDGELWEPPEWLVSFDVDAPGPDYPTGTGESNADHAHALRFASPADAMEFLSRVSTVCPTRPDGQPNRPLLAFTVEIVEIPEPPKRSAPSLFATMLVGVLVVVAYLRQA